MRIDSRIPLRAVHGVLHHARKPLGNHLSLAQPGFGENQHQGSVVMKRGEIHSPHQPADDARGVKPDALGNPVKSKSSHRQFAAARCRLIDGGGKVAIEGGPGQKTGPLIEQTVRIDRGESAAQPCLEGVLSDQR